MTDLEEIPRYKNEENHFNYTNLEKAERSKVLKDMERDYPRLPYAWLEMVYDWHKNTPKEEVDDIINSGKWEGPGQFSKNMGGTLKACEILDPSGNDEEKNITMI